jgi:hypothetical protein
MESVVVEALVQHIWNIESHHWMCTQCHALAEIEEECGGVGVKVPENPHLRELKRRRKEILRRLIVEEGKKVGGMRAENEVLVKLLQGDDTGNVNTYNQQSDDSISEY